MQHKAQIKKDPFLSIVLPVYLEAVAAEAQVSGLWSWSTEQFGKFKFSDLQGHKDSNKILQQLCW